MNTLSDQAFLALIALDNGAKMNCVHHVSRELIAAGLACEDWGRLGITESGRLRARQPGTLGRRLVIRDPDVADLWTTPAVSHAIDPLEAFNLEEVEASRPGTPPATLPRVKPGTPPVEPLPPPIEPAADDHTRALRAAGVATGLTGHEADPRWVREFVIAFVNS